MASTANEQPFDHNGECTFCDELAGHRADCSWLLDLIADHARLQQAAARLAVGTDDLTLVFEAQQAEIERLRAEVARLQQELVTRGRATSSTP
jgi:hypothetical protein